MAKQIPATTEQAIALREDERKAAQERERERIRVALLQAGHDRAHATVPFTKRARVDFLVMLGAGIPIFDICVALGVCRQTVYNHRRADSEFAEKWEQAIEMRYTPVEDRLADIAINGPADSMATVRAGEIMVKGSIPRFNRQPRGQDSGKTSATITDGTGRSITFSAGGVPLPD